MAEDPRPASGREAPPSGAGRNWAVAGIVAGALSLVLAPVLLGPVGMLFGAVGYVKGARRLGVIAVVVSILSLVLGSVLYVVLQNLTNQA